MAAQRVESIDLDLAWWFSPFPFACLFVVASDTALDHFVAEPIARHDEGSDAAQPKKNAPNATTIMICNQRGLMPSSIKPNLVLRPQFGSGESFEWRGACAPILLDR